MRIAITIIKESGRISPMFEASALAVVVECCRGEVRAEREVSLPVLVEDKIALLAAAGVRVLLCGAIANETAARVAAQGVVLHSFTAGVWRDVLSAWMVSRQVQACHVMPGCGRQRQQRCRGQGPARRNQE